MLVLSLCLGCVASDRSRRDASLDADTPRQDGGICCPLQEPDCECFLTGGWASSMEYCPGICDLDPQSFEIEEDAHGCPTYRFFGDTWGSCFGWEDAGAPDSAVNAH
jgi:hypothetical protein